MMIKITQKCSMGCIHCMDDCTPQGEHMSMEVFQDALDFQVKYGGIMCLISGGEPTEHPNFKEIVMKTCETIRDYPISINSNGLWLAENEPFMKMISEKYSNCFFQVVIDDRYYPIHVNENSPTFKYQNVVLCHDVAKIYPLGRAVKNNLGDEYKSSACFNIRALSKQLYTNELLVLINFLHKKGRFCTPHIDIKGNIILGESKFCPVCSNIYKSQKEIIQDIKNFQCHTCDAINKNLPKEYRYLIN